MEIKSIKTRTWYHWKKQRRVVPLCKLEENPVLPFGAAMPASVPTAAEEPRLCQIVTGPIDHADY